MLCINLLFQDTLLGEKWEEETASWSANNSIALYNV